MPACRVTAAERCPISAMPPRAATMVYPGGRTRCLYSSAPEYAFQVIPGDRDKLLVVFAAGGACFDKLTATVIHSCYRTKAEPAPLRGVMSRAASDSPFSSFTVVQVKYCSGDVHAGNVSQLFKDRQGAPVEQRGYYNTRSAIDWIKANLGRKFESFVLLGHSAGAIGVQLLAAELLQEFEYQRAGVLADSWAGVFPPGFEGPVFRRLGMCPVGFLQGAQREQCEAGNITIAGVFDTAMKRFPHVAFANINSKYDFGQIAYWDLASLTMRRFLGAALSRAEYLKHLSKILSSHSRNPNYAAFLKTGSEHIFLDGFKQDRLQSASAAPAQGPQVRLLDWLRNFSEPGAAPVRSICDEAHPQDECDGALAGKVLSLRPQGSPVL